MNSYIPSYFYELIYSFLTSFTRDPVTNHQRKKKHQFTLEMTMLKMTMMTMTLTMLMKTLSQPLLLPEIKISPPIPTFVNLLLVMWIAILYIRLSLPTTNPNLVHFVSSSFFLLSQIYTYLYLTT
jgi:hypothetical protein